MSIENPKQFISKLIEKNILVEKQALETITSLFEKNKILAKHVAENICNSNFTSLTDKIVKEKINLLGKKTGEKISVKKTHLKIRADYEGRLSLRKIKDNDIKKNADNFCNYFSSRYEKIKKILQSHLDINNLISIANIKSTPKSRQISVIGIVGEITNAKTGTIIFEIEDKTDAIKVFAKDPDLCKNLISDEVVAVNGVVFNNCILAKKIIFPEIPTPTKINKIKEPLKAVFISDIHIGSKQYLHNIEDKFLNWINKDKQTDSVKYLFIAGDNVDGVGIYPSQKQELQIDDIYKQYSLFEDFIEKIPDEIEIVICPGNHDAVMQFEPQFALDKVYVPNLINLSNIHLVKNPQYVYLNSDVEDYGLNVLMYHGYSFTKIINEIPVLRKKGIGCPEYVMIETLKKRHLAPIYGSSIINPLKEDYLVIDQIPDIFQTGDLHSHCMKNYKGITLISSSTFQGQTSFMNKIGHIANPGKVSIVDLHTREIFIKNFY